MIKDQDTLGLSGFTASGTPKLVTKALAEKAEREHAAGRPFKVNIYTGASTQDYADGALARANAIDRRSPYQNTPDLRKRINSHDAHYFDMHISELAQTLRYGMLGEVDYAIVDAASVDEKGNIVLGSGVGNIPTLCRMAKHIIVELNETIKPEIEGLHDIYIPYDPPYRREIPIYKASDRIGDTLLRVDPSKIIGVVKSNITDGVKKFTELDETSIQIGANVANFLISEYRKGGIPKEFLPLQSGVGNVANAVLFGLADATELPPFEMYTEVIQDAVITLMERERCRFASTCSMTITDDALAHVYDNIDFFRNKVLLRPSEISNNPEIIRRLGVIAMNTALEADIFGNVNSTHVLGTKMMNGIGGSGDFARNAYISIFSCPSVAKGGLISAIVPMTAHVDHSEHSVDVLITEQGIADLRGKDPVQRAVEIIENCAHPDYRPMLREYLRIGFGQTPHSLRAAFAMHDTFNTQGDMHLTDLSKYL